MPAAKGGCAFRRSDGGACAEPVEAGGRYCYWHDPHVKKSGPEVPERLQRWIHTGKSLEGFQLHGAQLLEAWMTLQDADRQLDLRRCNLSRADLSGAHLYAVDLRGSSLLKANCRDANLNGANLDQCDLLGVNLDGTRLEGVEWGAQLLQEQRGHEARRQGRRGQALADFREAEEVYRNLRLATERRGQFALSGNFFQREMTMRRYQLPVGSPSWAWSKLVDLLSGYGERPERVIGFSLLLILTCAVCYYFLGVRGPEGLIRFNAAAPLLDNARHFLDVLYFSVVTFTTLGYGDIAPLGHARPLAAFEAFCGAFTIALFVVVFVRKMTQ